MDLHKYQPELPLWRECDDRVMTYLVWVNINMESWVRWLWHVDPFLVNTRNTRKQKYNHCRKRCFLYGSHISIARYWKNKHVFLSVESSWDSDWIRFVGGDEKRSVESETIKYGLEFQVTRTWERLRWQGPAAYTKDRPVLSSERGPHKNKTVNVKQ
jgi:hypothetical protein